MRNFIKTLELLLLAPAFGNNLKTKRCQKNTPTTFW